MGKYKIKENVRKEFIAGFAAGLTCLGAVALILLLLYIL